MKRQTKWNSIRLPSDVTRLSCSLFHFVITGQCTCWYPNERQLGHWVSFFCLSPSIFACYSLTWRNAAQWLTGHSSDRWTSLSLWYLRRLRWPQALRMMFSFQSPTTFVSLWMTCSIYGRCPTVWSVSSMIGSFSKLLMRQHPTWSYRMRLSLEDRRWLGLASTLKTTYFSTDTLARSLGLKISMYMKISWSALVNLYSLLPASRNCRSTESWRSGFQYWPWCCSDLGDVDKKLLVSRPLMVSLCLSGLYLKKIERLVLHEYAGWFIFWTVTAWRNTEHYPRLGQASETFYTQQFLSCPVTSVVPLAGPFNIVCIASCADKQAIWSPVGSREVHSFGDAYVEIWCKREVARHSTCTGL